MSEIKDGGPAFPDGSQNQWGHPVHTGMTLRDYFAAKAMQADMSTYSEDLIYETPEWFEARAKKWYAVADAMLTARGKE
jgi:hypothetical protein